ncbi:Nudix hydrolase 14 [Arachis hypogaea]|nr:Nudix hydrolase 14 [Arachis hypogaea]
MLLLLESDGETYVVLTEQARVPTGRIILELPAGMTAPEELAKVRLIVSLFYWYW